MNATAVRCWQTQRRGAVKKYKHSATFRSGPAAEVAGEFPDLSIIVTGKLHFPPIDLTCSIEHERTK
jgi:hypothetical protein